MRGNISIGLGNENEKKGMNRECWWQRKVGGGGEKIGGGGGKGRYIKLMGQSWGFQRPSPLRGDKMLARSEESPSALSRCDVCVYRPRHDSSSQGWVRGIILCCISMQRPLFHAGHRREDCELFSLLQAVSQLRLCRLPPAGNKKQHLEQLDC